MLNIKNIVQAFKDGPHIFNLGHGITPDGDLNNIGADLGLSDILVTTDSGALRLFTNETRIEAGSEYLERDEEYYGGGLSVDAQVSDRLKISIDASYSRTERIEQQIRIEQLNRLPLQQKLILPNSTITKSAKCSCKILVWMNRVLLN